jgi:hypothetical protein
MWAPQLHNQRGYDYYLSSFLLRMDSKTNPIAIPAPIPTARLSIIAVPITAPMTSQEQILNLLEIS